MGFGLGLTRNRNANISLAKAREKYGDDPYFKEALKFDGKKKWFPKYRGDNDIPGLMIFDGEDKVVIKSGDSFNEAAFKEYVKEKDFDAKIRERAKTASEERADIFRRNGAPAGAGSSARDYSSYSSVTLDDLKKADRTGTGAKEAQRMIDAYGSDPYFADYVKSGGDVTRTARSGRSRVPKANYQGYFDYVNKRVASDEAAELRAARIEAANPTTDTTDTTDTTGAGGTLDELINSGASEEEIINQFLSDDGAATGSDAGTGTGTDAGTGTGGDSVINEITGGTNTGSIGTGGRVPINGIFYNENGDVTGFETEADRQAYTGTFANTGTGSSGTLGALSNTSFDSSSTTSNPFKTFVREEAAQNFAAQEDAVTEVAPNPTINIGGSLYDYDGNYVGIDPNLINVGGSLYDRDGNYIGLANPDASGDIIGGASASNPMFDAITAEQQAAATRAAEAVELMDQGYGRYNAGMRKLGIIGRQGEEYAPLILDQLRMAEMEAAQPQFAAFGFGENPMLGGMPQIGIQGVQGNVGGQSALSALSNAGLNQLQVSQQPYNRIALPDVNDAGQPISQVNNPTIFQASTSV